MLFYRHISLTRLFISVAILLLSASYLYADEEEFSAANRLLFMTDHLAGIVTPVTLNYGFTHQGIDDDGFDDAIKERIVKIKESGGKDIEVTLFTGDRQRFVPAFTDSRGNPVLTLFLQRDVNEMGNVTEGTWRYFHRQIKFALQDAADVEDVEFTFEDKSVKGQKIRITPYKNDTHSKELGDYADKYYTFTLSEEIPGYIYRIEAITPDKPTDAGSTDNITSDVLTFTGMDCPEEQTGCK